MKKLFSLIICASIFTVNVFGEDAVTKKKIELKEIPKEVSDIAKEKIKGFEGKDAYLKTEKEGNIYEIKGTANSKNIEAVVSLDKSGKITKVETELYIDVKDLPKEVLAAASAKVKGFEVKTVEVKEEVSGKEGKEYELKGTADNKDVVVELKADAAGKVTKVEVEAKKETVGDGD